MSAFQSPLNDKAFGRRVIFDCNSKHRSPVILRLRTVEPAAALLQPSSHSIAFLGDTT